MAFYERYWEHTAGEARSDFATKWPKLAPLIPRDPDAVIVDFGCGDGELIAQMRQINAAARYLGLDVSQTALEVATSRLPGAELHRIEDGGRFPVVDASADFLFTSEVIEHVYDTENAFAEMGRVLRLGGRLLLTTPYHGLIKNLSIVARGFDRHFDPAGPHIRFFSKRSLEKMLRAAGMRPIRFGHYGRFWPLPHSIYVLAERSD